MPQGWSHIAQSLQPCSTSLRTKSAERQQPLSLCGWKGNNPRHGARSLSVNNFLSLCLHGFDKQLRFQLSPWGEKSCRDRVERGLRIHSTGLIHLQGSFPEAAHRLCWQMFSPAPALSFGAGAAPPGLYSGSPLVCTAWRSHPSPCFAEIAGAMEPQTQIEISTSRRFEHGQEQNPALSAGVPPLQLTPRLARASWLGLVGLGQV